MSERDQFAMHALQGLLASEAYGDTGGAIFADKLSRKAGVYAALAYQLADAMLVARKAASLKPQPGELT